MPTLLHCSYTITDEQHNQCFRELNAIIFADTFFYFNGLLSHPESCTKSFSAARFRHAGWPPWLWGGGGGGGALSKNDFVRDSMMMMMNDIFITRYIQLHQSVFLLYTALGSQFASHNYYTKCYAAMNKLQFPMQIKNHSHWSIRFPQTRFTSGRTKIVNLHLYLKRSLLPSISCSRYAIVELRARVTLLINRTIRQVPCSDFE